MTQPGGDSGNSFFSEAYAKTLQGIGNANAGKKKWKDPLLGKEFQSYRILKKLGQGGMGVVYLGEHVLIKRKAAVKILKQEFCEDEEVVERFYQEGRAVASIAQENIIDVYDFGKTDSGQVFFIMEFLEGETLTSRLRRGPLPFSEAFPIITQITNALKAAHEKGVAHRDIKPDNIYLAKKPKQAIQVKILDFGLAKLVGKGSIRERLTQAGTILGTPHYMSPEQIDDAPIDGRADMYSLGAVIYEMFSQNPPFEGKTVGELIKKHLFSLPPPLKPHEDLQVPSGMSQIILRMLAKKPELRYPDMDALLQDLNAILAGEELSTTTRLQAPTNALSKRVRATPILFVFIAAAILASFLVMFVWRPFETSIPPETTESISQKSVPPVLDNHSLREIALTSLRQSLDSTETIVQATAAKSLGEVRDTQSVPHLITLLSAPDDLTRENASWALGMIGAQNAIEELRKVQTGLTNSSLAHAFDKALLQLQDSETKERLLSKLSAKDEEIRLKAALALAAQGETRAEQVLQEMRNEQSDVVKKYALSVLSHLMLFGDREAQANLLKLLTSKDEGARLAAAEVLANAGDDSGLETAQASLQDPNSKYRLIAAKVLVLLGDYSGYEVFSGALESTDPELRIAGAKGLGFIAEPSALPILQPVLQEDPDILVRLASAVAIIDILGLSPELLVKNSEEWLKEALISDNVDTRAQAAKALASVSPEKALPLLTKALQDQEAIVRKEAAEAMGKLGDKAAIPILIKAAADSAERVSIAAANAIGEIGGKEAANALENLPTQGLTGLAAAGILAQLGDQKALARIEEASRSTNISTRKAAMTAASKASLRKLLQQGLQDKSAAVRFEAAKELALLGDDSGSAILEKALQSQEGSTSVEAKSALTSLGLARDNNSKLVWPSTATTSTKEAVVKATASLAPKEASRLLRRALRDSDASIRSAAVAAIADLESKAPGIAESLYRLVSKQEINRTIREAARIAWARLQTEGPKSQSAAKILLSPESRPSEEETSLEVDSKQEEVRLLVATAETLIEGGSYRQAILRLKKAQSIQPSARIDFEMGEAYRKLAIRSAKLEKEERIEYWKKARTAYERYLSKGGRGSRGKKAKKALEEIQMDIATQEGL